ncbi:sugar kinase [Saccharophagus sp. K07]|jgi:2-dehydro-3-deoxygluconokinase|uniref:sugar kinase n=1 Tax=Saccharophagus sp. K07 TaxID=2283636 RepID=UPI0016525CE5|nr:sugar kinase [Saccharophagus sp. K07]MBC6904275.1 sugar kinase [Saccharophagus sp. K07]
MGIQILAIGEVMLELAPAGEFNGKKLMALGYAGDTYNTSIYLARLGVRTAYFTRLGDDPYSRELLQIMVQEGLDTASIEAVPGRTPGLYLIANQPNGERNFSFWRGQSPAREMFSTKESSSALEKRLQEVNTAYFSGVTIGILSDEARATLLCALAEFRARGGKVIFDNNYRPQLWRDRAHAQLAMDQSLAVADIALLTDDDAERLWGSGKPEDILDRCITAGVSEVVLKRGPNPVVVAIEPRDGQYQQRIQVEVPPVAKVVDTTAAGDSFNAGYLAARFAGENIDRAAARGSRCAGVVIQHRGAIVEREIFLREISA